MSFQMTVAAADYLERLAAEIEVPSNRYDEARHRYHSVGEWLGRDESTLKDYSPDVYVQGSFRLGTPIRPVNDSEHYDIDLVCELRLGKHEVTQQQLKEMLGKELSLYAEEQGMPPMSEGRRCWTLEYEDGAQFHLDALPAIPDGEGRRIVLESMALASDWSGTSIAITDKEQRGFETSTKNWPHSNPRGFTKWFQERMKVAVDKKRRELALEAAANVEDIPKYRVKAPLQQAIQLLKRHRDMMFAANADDKPISVILTTLAAKSYRNEGTVAEALVSILSGMDAHIEVRDGIYWVENPTDAAENFADRWESIPKRRDAFRRWLAMARTDFAEIARQHAQHRLVETASTSLGERLARSAQAKPTGLTLLSEALFKPIASVFTAPHKQVAPWAKTSTVTGSVSIANARALRPGFRPQRLFSDGAALAKLTTVEFTAKTDVPQPYDVYWQIVNTGTDAARSGKLRGDFDQGTIVRGEIFHTEDAAYSGTHSIECFIVKNKVLAARSGTFIVNVK
ncbi:nucleotidyltransferase [Massilia oculi]|uniref:nucleotidyltransferase n=1 Tax=Massilia oculi TaxID=945844 RepID=UPI0028AFD14F|nr:nucleotidyltransferase [Massilia oculi]